MTTVHQAENQTANVRFLKCSSAIIYSISASSVISLGDVFHTLKYVLFIMIPTFFILYNSISCYFASGLGGCRQVFTLLYGAELFALRFETLSVFLGIRSLDLS